MKETILIVDDIDENLYFLKMFLVNDYNVLSTTDAKEAIKIAKTKKIDLIVLDVIMPEIDGFEVCNILKNNSKTKKIPVIFVTSKIDEKSIVQGYEMGAVDYVTKPYKQMELLAKIKTHLKIKNLIEKLEYVATHDTMTDTLNRGEFFKLSQQRFDENSDNLFAVMIDIDNFKQINDTYGHSVGDQVIKEFANIVKGYIKKDTIFGRIGGEEFALVCNCNEDIANKIEVIRKAIEMTCVLIPYQEIKFTISIGLSNVTDKHKNIEDVLKSADYNLYEAKRSGKNKIVFRER